MTITRSDIVAEARTWLGTPWQHQQRLRGQAVDCVGLIIGVARAVGLVAPDWDVTGYSRTPDGTLLQLCDQHLQRIDRSALQPGDVVAVAMDVDPQHLGIVADYRHGGLSVIHAASHHGRVVEHRLMFDRAFFFRAAYSMLEIH